MANIIITPVEKLESFIANHEKLMTTTEQDTTSYKNAIENITYPVGKKLVLEIEITDSYLSTSLHDLLNNKIDGQNLLGFKVKSVGWDVASPEARIITKLDETIQYIQSIQHNLLKR